jgi:tetratricopeptide (TPR) repeat protein
VKSALTLRTWSQGINRRLRNIARPQEGSQEIQIMKSVIGIIAVLAMSSVASAQAEVWLANGAILKGNVVEDDGEKVKVALIAEGGTGATATYKYDQLAPHTIYRLRFNKTERDDVKGQIDLAAYALDNGVFPSARLSYDLAKKANDAKKAGLDAELEKLYARAPTVVLAWAKKQIDAKRYSEAHKYLRRLCELFPDREEGIEAHKLLEEIAPAYSSSQSEAVAKKAPGGKTAEEAAAPAKKLYDKAHATVRQAMAEYKKPVQVTRLLKTAIEEFQSAQKLLDQAAKKEGPGSELAARYDAWSEKVRDDIVETYVSIANSYFSRQSNAEAMHAIDEALLIDKNNSEALATRARIQIAMSDNNRWKW